MSGKRIVDERPCEHGFTKPHRWGGPPADPDWKKFPIMTNACVEGSRRTLTEGQYVLIEKVDGEWPEWAVGYLDGELFETDDDEGQLARVVLDALSDHTEGTP